MTFLRMIVSSAGFASPSTSIPSCPFAFAELPFVGGAEELSKPLSNHTADTPRSTADGSLRKVSRYLQVAGTRRGRVQLDAEGSDRLCMSSLFGVTDCDTLLA